MDVRRKVLLDLFASPSTLLPTVGGLSVLILSWAIDGPAAMNMVGLAGILGGMGWFATRLILGLKEITSEAYEFVQAQQRQKQEEALDDLDGRLRRDRDPRTQQCLRQLRDLYGRFVEDVKSGKINRSTHEIVEIVEELFRTSVTQLELSYKLWQTARKLTGDAKEKVIQQREEAVAEVDDTIRHLGTTIEQFFSFTRKKNKDNLGRLRNELDEAMRVARRTEERMASWDDKPYTETEFE